MRRRTAAILVFFLTLPTLAGGGPQVRCISPPAPSGLSAAVVTRVVDGDTIYVSVSRRREKVRLIGIDTPEVYPGEKLSRDVRSAGTSRAAIQALGRLSSEFTKRRLDGRNVGLETDVEKRDQYGRLLAYVWVSGQLFNMIILREGYAQVYTFPPNVKYAELFLACQREARENGRGLWGK